MNEQGLPKCINMVDAVDSGIRYFGVLREINRPQDFLPPFSHFHSVISTYQQFCEPKIKPFTCETPFLPRSARPTPPVDSLLRTMTVFIVKNYVLTTVRIWC
jgi:transposase